MRIRCQPASLPVPITLAKVCNRCIAAPTLISGTGTNSGDSICNRYHRHPLPSLIPLLPCRLRRVTIPLKVRDTSKYLKYFSYPLVYCIAYRSSVLLIVAVARSKDASGFPPLVRLCIYFRLLAFSSCVE